MSVARNCFISFEGAMPTQHRQFRAYEGVASGQQVIHAYEISFQALRKLPERAQREGSSEEYWVRSRKSEVPPAPREQRERLSESVMANRS